MAYVKRKKSLVGIPTEDQEQIKLCQWMELKKIIFYAIPNGGYRHELEAFKFKRMGVKSGVPDVCIPVPNKSYHGLYIELKRVSGSATSPNQLFWQAALKEMGYCSEICKGFDQAIKVISDYLNLGYILPPKAA